MKVGWDPCKCVLGCIPCNMYMYRIYSSTSRTFLYLKISPKTGVRLILEASEMTCSNHGTNTYENMRLPYLFASASICTYLINIIEPQ